MEFNIWKLPVLLLKYINVVPDKSRASFNILSHPPIHPQYL